MSEINLCFEGPVAVNECFDIDYQKRTVCFKNDLRGLAIKPKTPGIYIWGHKNDGAFIPYYVGKIHGCILNRIKSHVSDIIREDSTYPRLSSDYMYGRNGVVPFYKDDLFLKDLVDTGRTKLPNWIKDEYDHFKSRIVYYGNKEFLSMFANVDDPKYFTNSRGYTICNLNIDRAKDDALLNGIKDLYFVWAEYRSLETGSSLNDIYETLEAYVRYMLNGKTFCSSYKYKTTISKLKDKNINKVNISCHHDLKYLFKSSANDEYYDGY